MWPDLLTASALAHLLSVNIIMTERKYNQNDFYVSFI